MGLEEWGAEIVTSHWRPQLGAFLLYLHGEGQPSVLVASKEPGIALARGRARTANTGAGACYIRPVKLGPLLFPKGTVASSSFSSAR